MHLLFQNSSEGQLTLSEDELVYRGKKAITRALLDRSKKLSSNTVVVVETISLGVYPQVERLQKQLGNHATFRRRTFPKKINTSGLGCPSKSNLRPNPVVVAIRMNDRARRSRNLLLAVLLGPLLVSCATGPREDRLAGGLSAKDIKALSKMYEQNALIMEAATALMVDYIELAYYEHGEVAELAEAARSLLKRYETQLIAKQDREPLVIDGKELGKVWDECITRAWQVKEVSINNNYYTNAGKEVPYVEIALKKEPLIINIYRDETVKLEKEIVPPRTNYGRKWAPGVYIVGTERIRR